VLKVENLQVHYGKIKALQGVNFEIHKGEIVTLIGSNGAGKTTNLKTISGLLKPAGGRILFENEPIHKLPAHKVAQMGIVQVPEGRGVFANLSVKENLELGGYLKSKHHVKEKFDEVFDLFPRLEERIKQKAGTLSGGEQQMLAIGRAMVAEPDLLLLDEPSLGLAPVIVQNIFSIIKKLNQEKNLTILLVEQNAQMALSVSSRGYIIETGHIVKSDESSKLLHDDEVKKAYLGG
jgi:branched-chain amino acid transport system ATP-binding protein